MVTIDLQQIIDSSLGVRLISGIARTLSPRLGHRLADFVAEQIARRRDSRLVQAVRANQWVVRGETLDGEALDQAVLETLRHSARSIFDLYHYVQDLPATKQLIVLDSRFLQTARRSEFEHRGLIIAGLHLSNFDLVLQWLCQQWMEPLVLTIPDPQGARRTEYERRKKIGMNLVPVSGGALRQALKHLRGGGVVLTGIDRPIPKPGACPRFFGRPAALPIHHIFLATRAKVPIVIMAPKQQPDGKYHLLASDPVEMDSHPDREMEALRNAEKVLNIAEGFIQLAPGQWSMSLPVWPEALDLVPE